MQIGILPAIEGTEFLQRNFIRFAVWHVPEVMAGQIMPHGKEWYFRADFLVGEVQHHVSWYQPDQPEEPQPNAALFIRALLQSLTRAKEDNNL